MEGWNKYALVWPLSPFFFAQLSNLPADGKSAFADIWMEAKRRWTRVA